MNNETVQTTRPATDGQKDDIRRVIEQCFSKDFSFDDANAIIGNKTPFMNDIRVVLMKHSVEPIKKAVAEWQEFYKAEFGLSLNFDTLRIPVKPEGFNLLIVVARGITAQQVFDRCATYFPCWKYTDDSLDEVVRTNERNPKKGSYALWVQDSVEADEVHKNKSANQIKADGIATETLLERLLHELVVYKKTGEHLDISSWTLCSGSRLSVGDVPRVGWRGVELRVGWCDSGGAGGRLRAREVAV